MIGSIVARLGVCFVALRCLFVLFATVDVCFVGCFGLCSFIAYLRCVDLFYDLWLLLSLFIVLGFWFVICSF